MQRRHEPTIKTKSAALLAAEAAFAPPRQTAEQLFERGLPRITVLRAKGVTALLDCAGSVPSSVSESANLREPQLSALKAPRVFLLTSAHVESGSTQSEWPLREVQADEAGPAAPPLLGLGGMESTPVRRARRSRKRPPPVTLVFSAIAVAGDGAVQLSTAQGPGPAMRVEAQGDLPAYQSARLAPALATVEPVFVAISSAMRFTVDDPQMAVQWQRLSRALDQIAVEIRTSSPTAIF
jgi:hypothetical protein